MVIFNLYDHLYALMCKKRENNKRIIHHFLSIAFCHILDRHKGFERECSLGRRKASWSSLLVDCSSPIRSRLSCIEWLSSPCFLVSFPYPSGVSTVVDVSNSLFFDAVSGLTSLTIFSSPSFYSLHLSYLAYNHLISVLRLYSDTNFGFTCFLVGHGVEQFFRSTESFL